VDGLLTDKDLSAAVSGDGRSAEKIYRSLSPKVMGYLQARGVEDIEAVAQEVFLTVFQKLDNVTGGVAGLKTFTFSVAHARVVDAARARARHPHLAEYDPDFDTRTVSSAEQVVVDRSGGDTVQLLQTLNPDQREVLSLRIVAGLPIDQVARVMGKSEGSVKQLQRRALAKLKDLVVGSQVGGAP
jgi:RNA polymerase sigma factor (sigma-70 family)